LGEVIDMRCIDADALEKEGWSLHRDIQVDKNTREYQTKPLRQVPTIVPERKKGHWIRHPEQRNIFNGKTIECSECHEKYTVQYVEDELFCRHCGADMREDGEAYEGD
jgi:formylmethanofuran dehydrogenase subunit E